MSKSVKLRVTIWFALVLVIVSAIALLAMYMHSEQVLIGNQKNHIQISVGEFAKKTTYKDGELKIPAGARFYERNVYRMVFNADGDLLLGELPEQLQNTRFSFLLNTVREQKTADMFYLEYDQEITLSSKTYYVKGICVLSDEHQTLNQTLRTGIILISVLVLTAAGCVYFIMCKAFAPVEKIRKTAKQIADGKDLTKRIQIGNGSDELHRLANSFDEMLDKLQQTLEREKQFSADASHELRTPIAVIRSECEFLQNSNCSEAEYKEAIDAIYRQAERMQNMANGLLMISKMESSSLPMQQEETDLSELLTFVCDDQEEIQSPKITLVKNIPEKIIATVDRDLITRLCINLLSNAYQYSKETGIITVTLQKNERNIEISVADTGIGIPEEALPHIWDRFYRVDTSRNGNEKNSIGLGLPMVKQIAQQHGGTVHVESRLGEGSRFVVNLPKSSKEYPTLSTAT